MIDIERVNAELQDLKTRLVSVDKGIIRTRKQLTPLQRTLTNQCNIRSNIKDQISVLQQKLVIEENDPDSLALFYLNSPNSGSEVYNAATKFFNDLGVAQSGFFPETGQYQIQIAMYQDRSNLVQILEALTRLAPHIKPIADSRTGDLYKCIAIMEEDLHEFYHYEIRYYILANEWVLIRDRSELIRTKNLEDVLVQACKSCYYIGIDSEDEICY